MSANKKIQLLKDKILKDFGGDKRKCVKIFKLMDDMESANIPMGYWFLKMSEFKGSPVLKNIVENYIDNLQENYLSGNSICLAGNQGTGKTMSSICIAKEAIKQNFTAYYITASDMLTEMTDPNLRSLVRSKLRDSDFLIIDEVDSRFFISDATKELFSGLYENIFRFRSHNTLPTIICTNETNDILNVFYGQSVQAIQSLNAQYLSKYTIAGKDFRNKIGVSE